MKPLESERLALRPLEESDLKKNLNWINDPDIYSVMGVRGPISTAQQSQWYANLCVNDRNVVFSITLKKTGKYIGNVSLFDINYNHSNAGLTVFIGDKEERGMGYAKESVALLCHYAFHYLNLYRVYVKTDNEVAASIYRDLGFVEEGVLRSHSFYAGRYVDKMLFGVLRPEFKGLSEVV